MGAPYIYIYIYIYDISRLRVKGYENFFSSYGIINNGEKWHSQP